MEMTVGVPGILYPHGEILPLDLFFAGVTFAREVQSKFQYLTIDIFVRASHLPCRGYKETKRAGFTFRFLGAHWRLIELREEQ